MDDHDHLGKFLVVCHHLVKGEPTTFMFKEGTLVCEDCYRVIDSHLLKDDSTIVDMLTTGCMVCSLNKIHDIMNKELKKLEE